MRKRITLILAAVLCSAFVHSGCASDRSPLEEKLDTLRWICYSPTDFDPVKNSYPSEASVREDLTVLKEYGFNGVITYGAQGVLGQIPEIAVSVGFRGVIMGVYDPKSENELSTAKAVSHYVDGYCLGNEGLFSRYTLDELKQALREIKDATGKPATTSEQIGGYAKDDVFNVGDWIFPNIHPFLYGVTKPAAAAEWIHKHYLRLKKHADGRAVFFKEVGYPTAGAAMASSSHQSEFFVSVGKWYFPFAYFEAFDQPWKTDLPVEPYWGLFTADRSPKQFVRKHLR